MPRTYIRLCLPGAIVCTPRALRALSIAKVDPDDLIDLHLSGEYDVVCAEDQEENIRAIKDGLPVKSSFLLPTQVRLWLITEADRSATRLILADEY